MINEIAKLLSERSEKSAFPLELPTMDDLIEVQEVILISVPVDFRDYLLHSSDQSYGRLEPVTIADPHSHTHLPEVAAKAWDLGMPREMIPLCQCGKNYYCVAQDDEVFLWMGGENMEYISDSVWAWVRDVWLES